jgi:periplasmic divalent cation tolerance protein
MSAQASLVYTTLPDMEQARRLGEQLVREKLAACVNMFAGMQSIYEWKCGIEHDEEVVLIAKTVPELAERVMRRIGELHPYEVPAILLLPVEKVAESYLAWLRQSTESA